MAEKLSRKQKFQELRDEIERDALASNLDKNKEIQLSRSTKSNLSHANIPVHPHEDVTVAKDIASTNQVMDELLGEVKQYNISTGNRYTDDTQINILKQLDSSTPSARNQHIMPMEEDDENLGSTMEMPRTSSFGNDIPGVATFMPNQKLNRMNPVEPDLNIYDDFSVKDETDEMAFDDYFKSTDDKIVLGSSDIRADRLQDTDHLDLFEPGKFTPEEKKEEEQPEEKPAKLLKKKEKKAKKEKKVKKVKKAKPVQPVVDETEEKEVPSAKIRIQTSEAEEAEAEGPNKSGVVLNVILGILIVALFASIAFTLYFLWQLGK